MTAISLSGHPSDRNEPPSHSCAWGTGRNMELGTGISAVLIPRKNTPQNVWIKEQMGSYMTAPAESNSVGQKTNFQDWTSRRKSINTILHPTSQTSFPFISEMCIFHENSTAENVSELPLLLSKSQLNCLNRWCYFMANRWSQYCRKIIFKKTHSIICCEKDNKSSFHPKPALLIKIPENQAETVNTSATMSIQQFNIWYCECCNCYLLI